MIKRRSRFGDIYVALLLLIMYLPILVVVVYSFNNTKQFMWQGFSLEWYAKLFSNKTIHTSFVSSLQLALISAGMSALLGTAGAVALSGREFVSKGLLENVTLIPIMVPEIILGMAYLAFFTYLKAPFGMLTLAIAHTTFCVPYVYVNVKARLAGMDPALGEAALDLGASRLRMFFDITLPLILPSVASGALLAFAMSMDDVVISFFTTGTKVNTLPLYVYSSLKVGVTPEINALCTVMLGAVFLLVALYNLVRSHRAATKV